MSSHTESMGLCRYLVGGAVRDRLLGRAVSERDWVVLNAESTQMLALGFKSVGADFPVFLHPDTGEEHALARTERKTGSGHRGFQTRTEGVSLEQDLSRRDLTINAIAETDDGVLIDPYAGQTDLENRVLRHVTEAFREDPLRVLRVARFQAQLSEFGFRIASDTRNLMREMAEAGDLCQLTPERVWRETEKALKSARPRLFFEALREVGALSVVYPEVDALFGVPQRADYHPEIDTGLHTMLSLDAIAGVSADSRLRFAVLVHDLGKAETPADILPGHRGHEARSAVLTQKLCDRLKVPNAYRRLAVPVAHHHLRCHQALELRAGTIESLLAELGSWKPTSLLGDFLLCCRADARGRTGLENREYPQLAFLEECASAAADIDVKSLLESGYQGEKLGQQIKQRRCERITQVKQRYRDIDEARFAKLPA